MVNRVTFNHTILASIIILFTCNLSADGILADSISVDKVIRNNHYVILSGDEIIGYSVLKSIYNTQEITLFESSSIKASGWWGSIDLESVSTESYSAKGEFLSLNNILLNNDDNQSFWVQLDRKDNLIVGSLKIGEEISGPERKRFNGYVGSIKQLGQTQSKSLDNLITSSKVILESLPGGDFFELSSQGFDTTLSALPFYLRPFTMDDLNISLKILDTDEVTIEKAKIRSLGKQIVLINSTPMNAFHLTISFENKALQNMWISDNNETYPYIIKYTWEDDSGANEIRLK